MTAVATKTVKYRFELLGGRHYERNPDFHGPNPHDPDRMIMFVKGDVVESERELDKIYVEHFRRIVERPDKPATEERKQAVSALILSGAWVEDDRSFLESLTDDGFGRILARTGAVQTQATQAVEPVVKVTEETSTILGENVTHLFQVAYDEGFRVFRATSGKHSVCRPSKTDMPLNPKPLFANQVDKFILDYLKETK